VVADPFWDYLAYRIIYAHPHAAGQTYLLGWEEAAARY